MILALEKENQNKNYKFLVKSIQRGSANNKAYGKQSRTMEKFIATNKCFRKQKRCSTNECKK